MPISYKRGKPEAKSWIESRITTPDFTIFDLGCGYGTYGELITAPCVKVGVDVMDYHQKGDWATKYSRYIISDIRNTHAYLPEGDSRTDLAILGDVLEHLTVEDATQLIAKLKERFQYLLIAVPYLYPQASRNTYEVHRQADLTDAIFNERYSGFHLLHQVIKSGKPVYGYYTWSSK